MNHLECGSKTACFNWKTKKENGYCKGCIFHLTNYSKQKSEPEEAEGAKITWIHSLDTLPMIRDELKEKYPYGHPKFIDLILDEIRLHSDKNHDFAKGGNPLGNFNRVGAILDLYPGLKSGDPVVVAVSFLLKQLDASLWMYSQGTKAKIEGHTERWRDISVYSKIIPLLIEEGVVGDCGPYAA